MKIDAKKLRSILKPLTSLAPSNPIVPFASTILFTERYAMATDLETTLKYTWGEDVAWGTEPVAVEAKKLSEILSKLSGEIEITVSNIRVTIKSGGAKLTIHGYDPKTFTDAGGLYDKENLLRIEHDVVPYIVEAAGYTAENLSDIYSELSCVSLRDGVVSASNRAMVYINESMEGLMPGVDISIPKPLVNALASINPTKVWTDGRMLVFKNENTSYSGLGRLQDKKLPEMRVVVPKDEALHVTLDTELFKASIARVAMCSPDLIPYVDIVVSDGVYINTKDVDMGSDASDRVSDITGNKKVSVNHQYLRKIIDIQDDNVTIELRGKMDPIVVRYNKSIRVLAAMNI